MDTQHSSLYKLPPLPGLPIKDMNGPFAWCNWVIGRQVLMGAFPATLDDAETNVIMRTFLLLGICTFVCLQAEFRLDEPERNWRSGKGLRPYIKDATALLSAGQENGIAQTKLDFLHLAIVDGSITSDAAMDRLVDDVKQRVQRGERIYIHCWGGHGRTGTLVALLLSRLYNLGPRQALEYTQALHDARANSQGVRSPQTRIQRDQVRRIISYKAQAKLIAEGRLPQLLKAGSLGRPIGGTLLPAHSSVAGAGDATAARPGLLKSSSASSYGRPTHTSLSRPSTARPASASGAPTGLQAAAVNARLFQRGTPETYRHKASSKAFSSRQAPGLDAGSPRFPGVPTRQPVQPNDQQAGSPAGVELLARMQSSNATPARPQSATGRMPTNQSSSQAQPQSQRSAGTAGGGIFPGWPPSLAHLLSREGELGNTRQPQVARSRSFSQAATAGPAILAAGRTMSSLASLEVPGTLETREREKALPPWSSSQQLRAPDRMHWREPKQLGRQQQLSSETGQTEAAVPGTTPDQVQHPPDPWRAQQGNSSTEDIDKQQLNLRAAQEEQALQDAASASAVLSPIGRPSSAAQRAVDRPLTPPPAPPGLMLQSQAFNNNQPSALTGRSQGRFDARSGLRRPFGQTSEQTLGTARRAPSPARRSTSRPQTPLRPQTPPQAVSELLEIQADGTGTASCTPRRPTTPGRQGNEDLGRGHINLALRKSFKAARRLSNGGSILSEVGQGGDYTIPAARGSPQRPATPTRSRGERLLQMPALTPLSAPGKTLPKKLSLTGKGVARTLDLWSK